MRGLPKDRQSPLRQPMFSAATIPFNLSVELMYLQRTPETPSNLFTLEELYAVMMIGYETRPSHGRLSRTRGFFTFPVETALPKGFFAGSRARV